MIETILLQQCGSRGLPFVDADLDAYGTLLSGLYLKNRYPDVVSYPTVEAWRKFLYKEAPPGRKEAFREYALHGAAITVPGRALLYCDNNTLALGPASTRPGKFTEVVSQKE
jgi:hypothetical protein